MWFLSRHTYTVPLCRYKRHKEVMEPWAFPYALPCLGIKQKQPWAEACTKSALKPSSCRSHGLLTAVWTSAGMCISAGRRFSTAGISVRWMVMFPGAVHPQHPLGRWQSGIPAPKQWTPTRLHRSNPKQTCTFSLQFPPGHFWILDENSFSIKHFVSRISQRGCS